ncbi:MAG: DHH family phosphoesterase, partial [Patescibacteria group bacterium]
MVHPLVERILEGRDIPDREAFLAPSYGDRPDPFLMKDMDRAVGRALKAIANKEKIAVWHDYDCDGVPGGALLSDFFLAIGYPVRVHAPERADGYGLNAKSLATLRDEGVSLVITVDCGITDVKEVEYANALGIDVIVTDHHLPQSELPKAYAVVNSHRADDAYPFKGLCGTGVAFKLVEGLVARGGFPLPAGWEKWLLDLVALATVADMVPLTGENRTLVRFGLTVMRKGRRPGIRALLEAERVPFASVTEDDIAFSVAPKINAASRMASPALALELLTTPDMSRARELANTLISLNKDRKLEGMRVAKEVKRHIEMLPTLGDIIVTGSESWRPSLLGIA